MFKQETFDAIRAAGFTIYMRKPEDTWLYFTDGQYIGYAQTTRHGYVELSTVHIPNKTTGTGFKLDPIPRVDAENLAKAFVHAPSWASSTDRQSVRKWPSWDAYVASSAFNAAYREVEQ